jgi:hypothetical protein
MYKLYVSVCPKNNGYSVRQNQRTRENCLCFGGCTLLGIYLSFAFKQTIQDHLLLHLLHHRYCLVLKGPPWGAGTGFDPGVCLTTVRRNNLATPHLNLVTPHPNLATPHSNLATPHPNLATPHSNLATPPLT